MRNGVPANGLKPESEGTFNSEDTLFLARKKKKHILGKGAGWNAQFRNITHLQAGEQEPSICLTTPAVCITRQQVNKIQHHMSQLLFQK